MGVLFSPANRFSAQDFFVVGRIPVGSQGGGDFFKIVTAVCGVLFSQGCLSRRFLPSRLKAGFQQSSIIIVKERGARFSKDVTIPSTTYVYE